MANRRTTIAIDGGGRTKIEFIKGRNSSVSFGTGPNIPIRIDTCQPKEFKAGDCSHCWFTMNIEEASDSEFIRVRVTTDANSSMNFNPDGLNGYHVNPGAIAVLSYNTDEGGQLLTDD